MLDIMSTTARASAQSLRIEIRRLKRDVHILRSGLVSLLGEDAEGEYRPGFVAQILAAVDEQPTETFISPRVFRAALRRA